MKFFVNIFLCLLFISFSCKKNDDGNNGGNGGGGAGSGGVNDSIYLVKVVTIDTSLPTGADTMSTISVRYDSQKRIDSMITITYPFRPSVLTYKDYEKRFYNGTDTLPSKTFTVQISGTGSIQYTTHFLYYDSDNVIFKDSIIYTYSQNPSIDISRKLYYRTSNRITSIGQFLSSSSQFQTFDSTISIVIKNAGNTISSSDSVFYGSSASSVNNITTYTASYDNKPNPFNRIKLPYPAYIYNYFGHHLQKAFNNLVSSDYERKSSSGSTNNSAFASYIYNSNGYPVVSWFTHVPSFTKSKAFIYYTAP